MAEEKQVRHKADSDLVVNRSKDFWSKNGRALIIGSAVIILLGLGYLGYKYFVKEPKEQKAAEAIWKAEDYFSQDSMKLALSGDRQFPGAEKVATQYSGTKTGNLASLYAGISALKTGDNTKAVKFLKDFSTDAKQVQARAYKLLGDAYANLGKNSDALSAYKKAAHEFTADKQSSAEYLFFAAYFADRVANDKKEAVSLYKELLKDYSDSQFSGEAQKYLAQAGELKSED